VQGGPRRAVRYRPTARNGDFDVAMLPERTVTYILKKAGAIDYYCRFHPNMKAVLNVAP
jgi:plastocyanin